MKWMLRMCRMGSCPCKQPGRPCRPISLQPFGQVPCRAVCGVAALANSRAIGCTPRLASHPGKVLVRPRKDLEQVLSQRARIEVSASGLELVAAVQVGFERVVGQPVHAGVPVTHVPAGLAEGVVEAILQGGLDGLGLGCVLAGPAFLRRFYGPPHSLCTLFTATF